MNKLRSKRKTHRIGKIEKPRVIKGFKAVEWTRKIRDKMFEKNKNLNMSEYVKQ